jgi:mannan endo-1,4-beta-mannosidase
MLRSIRALVLVAFAACTGPLVDEGALGAAWETLDAGDGKGDDPSPVEPEAACTDVAPDDTYTCAEQVSWGQCGESWMAGFCDRSCGRCPGIGNVVAACTDVAPGTQYTCAQQAAWGKCGEPWMAGFCHQSCDRCPIASQLVDPDATPRTQGLMRYLVSVYRTKILSGQQSRADADYLKTLTGRHPAIVGFDLMNYSPSRVERGSQSTDVDEAIAWSRDEGGIVTLSWHWNAPADLVDSDEWPWWKGFYTKGTTFDFARAIYDRSSTERRLLIRDIDAIAVQLARLEDAGVPVLWRPLHEASGEWFWWGAHGPQAYIQLWRLLYDRLANHHRLHNLIWVWNGQHRDFYPGDAYVDIVAEDIYDAERDYEPQEAKYREASRYTSMPKLVALSETGALLDPVRLVASAARWSWFTLWSGDFARAQTWNEDAMKREVYGSDFVITLDELPDL